ncbi:MFS transporter [Trinickia dinghuensis]|uniref:MFS transporter n=2 Tax=Trinickia dinghuensis TaxID=2291023 RepID=A0A3D8K2K6_9BURK|nr:MFS transporter [Trinickia dinghuensis]
MLGVALSFTMPYLSLFGVEEASMSPWRLGVFMTVISASGVFASAAVGRWSDRTGRPRAFLVASLVVAVLGYASLSFVRGYVELLLVGVALLGPGGASLSQIFTFGRAALPAEDTAQAEFASATLRTLLSAAWVFGPAVGALVLAQAGFKGLFAFAAVSFAASAVIALLISDAKKGSRHSTLAGGDCETSTKGGADSVSASASVVDPMSMTAAHNGASNTGATPQERRAIPRILLALTLIGLAANATMILLPLYLVHALHGTRLTVSAALGAGALLEIPMMLWLGAKSSRLRKQNWLTASAAVHVVYFVALAMIEQPWAVVPLQVLPATVIAITSCLGMTYIQDLMPGETGAATALFFNAWRMGSILSGVLSGVIVGAFGYRVAFLLCAALAACAFALLSFDTMRMQRRGLRAAVRRA